MAPSDCASAYSGSAVSLQAQGAARGHGLDGGGVLQRARHALPRRRDAHIQRQHIVAQRRAALQQHLICLSHAQSERVSAHCAWRSRPTPRVSNRRNGCKACQAKPKTLTVNHRAVAPAGRGPRRAPAPGARARSAPGAPGPGGTRRSCTSRPRSRGACRCGAARSKAEVHPRMVLFV